MKPGFLRPLLTALPCVFLAAWAQSQPSSPQPDRSIPVPPAVIRPPDAPLLEKSVLKDGLTLVLGRLPRPDRPDAVNLSFLFPLGGSGADSPDKRGLARVAASLMRGEETGSSPHMRGVMEAADRLGVRIQANVSKDAMVVSVWTTRDHLGKTLDLLRTLLKVPAYSDADFQKAIQSAANSFLSPPRGSDAFAQQRLALLLGLEKPGASGRGISVRDVRDFYDSRLSLKNAILAAGGGLSMKDLRSQVDKHLDGRFGSGPSPEAPPVPAVRPVPAQNRAPGVPVHIIAGRQPFKSRVLVGSLAVGSGDPDFPAFLVINSVLGDNLITGRLNQSLRENRLWTYSVMSYMQDRSLGRMYVTETTVKAGLTTACLMGILDEFRRIGDAPVSPEELEKAKIHAIHEIRSTLETPQGASLGTATGVFYKPSEASIGYLERDVERVGSADVLRVARKILNPQTLAVVIDGNANLVLSQLTSLGGIRISVE